MSDFREAMRRAREERQAEDAAADDPAHQVADRRDRDREKREEERFRKLYAVVYDIRSILLFYLVLTLLGAAAWLYLVFRASSR